MLRRKLVRDLSRQRTQAVAIALTLFLGSALFGASYDAYRNLDASYQRVFDETDAADLTVSGGDTGRFAAAARTDPGVAAVSTRTQADVPLQIGRSRLLGRLVGVPPSGTPAVDRTFLLAGRPVDPSDPRGVLVERHAAEYFHLDPGVHVRALGSAGWVDLTVNGVAASAEYLWPARSRQDIFPAPGTFAVMFVPEPLVAAISRSATPQALVRYSRGADRDQLTKTLTDLAAKNGASSTTTRADQASNAALREDIDGFRELSVMFPALFMLGAALATSVLLSRRVNAERRIIGTLRANGASGAAVLAHYASYGLVLGAVGGGLGAVAGLFGARAVTHLYTGALSIPVTVAPIHPGTALIGFSLAALIGLMAAAVPARAAARVEPAVALSGARSGRVFGRRSLLERILVPLRWLPLRHRHVVRSIGRNPRRSATTILGVILAATLILTAWGMLDTTQLLLKRQFGEVERQDATVVFTSNVTEPLTRRVLALDGVAAAEPAAAVPVTLSSSGGSYPTTLFALTRNTSMHGFPNPSAPARGMVVGKALKDQLGIRVGDSIELTAPDAKPVKAPVTGFVDEPLGTNAYTDLGLLRSLSGGRVPESQLLVRFSAGADREALIRRLQNLPSVAVVLDANALRQEFDRYLGLFYAFVGLMLVFAAVLAFAVMFTTMSANLSERVVEVTTLRANGVSHAAIARLLRTENMLLTVVGIALGLPIAWFVAARFMSVYSSDLFQFDLQLRTRTPLLLIGALLAVAMLSQWPGLRALRRIDIGQVVRERAD